MFIWGAVESLSIFAAFSYWWWFKNSLIDLINFAATAALMGQNLFYLILLSFSLDDEGARGNFFYSGIVGASVPLFGWPIVLLAYLADSYLYRSTYSSVNYIVVKFLLFFIYNLVIAFFAFETLFPAYAWW